MPYSRPAPESRRRRPALVLTLIALWLAGFTAAPPASAQAPPPFRNFEGPQVHPLALTPDGTRLLATNTPNGTLSVFQLTSGAPVLTAEIPVGLEPVSVAARNDREAWVVNWLSDSVSVVDLSTGNVVRTIEVGDEPTDVLFAGLNREMAFVCVSGGASLLNFSTNPNNLGRGQIKVFDPANPSAAPTTVEIFGKQPRALARDATGARVFVSVFESGNQTTIVPEANVKAGGGLPAPSIPVTAPGAAPSTGLIVKWNGSQWVDEINRAWNSAVPYTLADNDVAVIDASGASLPATVAANVRGLGTHIGNMAFDPVQSRLFVANLEDINQVRFEPAVRGRFQASRVSILSAVAGTAPSLSSVSDLNSHVNFANPAGSDAERALSLAMPGDIARQADGTVYVAATSSARVGVLSPSGVVTARIAVGQGPTGLAVDDARQRLYVYNRFDQTLSVVDTGSKAQTASVPVGFNPEPAAVRAGRRFLYDASLSAHGTVSCASCHLNGHRDGVAWDLGNPQGTPDLVNVSFAGIGGTESLHPMKGPMTTQSLRGIIGTEPLHWRGDRAGLESFNGAFVSLLGRAEQLTGEEMASFKEFVRSLTYPPNPHEPLNRQMSPQAQSGLGFFSFEKLDAHILNCSDCHIVAGFRPGTNNTVTPSLALQEPQAIKVPQLRGLYQKTGLFKTPGDKITGYGFAHDGGFDTLFNFMKAAVFNFTQVDLATADSWRRDMERMIIELDTGTPPAVGLQVTVRADNKTASAVTTRIALLEQQAAAGNCDLVVRGLYSGSPRAFLRLPNGTYQPDSLLEAAVSRQTLLDAVAAGSELTFTGVPAGQGRAFSIDRDNNGQLNDDEPRTSVGVAGRVVNASGAGLSGVVVALSGSQSATAVTDASGRYVFNFVSTGGSYTVTPQQSGQTFAPASRSFQNPTWNVQASFVSSAGNASDSTQFFVTQHYHDFFAREPDAPGLAHWTNVADNCGESDLLVCRINVSAAFFLSIEFQQTGYLVYKTNKASFGDLNPPAVPVPVTYAQLMADTQRIGRNVIVNQGAWQAQLETNKAAFFQGWVQRPQFLAQFPLGMAPTAFVDQLNARAGGPLDATERQNLVNELSANNTTAGRASVVRKVAEDATLDAAEKNRAFVLMQYFGYLRRNPNDAPEQNLDFSGYNHWLGNLEKFNGNFVQAELVKAFITSTEYRQRFGQ